jgi:primosomal protein N' (replication factor Y)
MSIVRVALDVPLPELFDYRAAGDASTLVGCRVRVPFGRSHRVGVVVETARESGVPAGRLKFVDSVFHDMPPLPEDLFRLFRFCAAYYQHPLGEVILNALPPRLRQPQALRDEAPAAWRLTGTGAAVAIDALPRRALVLRSLLGAFQQKPEWTLTELQNELGRDRAALKPLLDQGWIEPCAAASLPSSQTPPVLPELTADQQRVCAALDAQPEGFGVSLLHGVTGSGKTEVYFRRIARCLEAGQQALVLVPEINLTPQTEARFLARFPGRHIVALHSGMAEGERTHNWLAAHRGEADIVLGTRLSVFTPLPRLGLVIIDEEHDGSYKQQDGLRYSARDVAIVRAQQRGVPILLGSATPSLETWHNATGGRYALLDLPSRAVAQASLPEVRCIDLNAHKPEQGLSAPLVAALKRNLERGEQSLLFLNRRGYAPVLFCTQCGWAAPCHRCSARLTLHARSHKLRCHHCGHEEAIHGACPDCGNPDLFALGQGTQRLEEELARHLPGARILRVDRDTTRRRDAMDQVLQRVHGGQVDILVGTQMLAKGHDFPQLTLVGVVNPDGALYSPDFRAGEQLFALLMQVAGRAGRADLPGQVLIQTYIPRHPLFAAVAGHDFSGYAKALLAERKVAGFPPYCHQALLRAEAADWGPVQQFLRAAKQLAPEVAGVEVYDPVPAQMARLAGKERGQILVQSSSRKALQQFLAGWSAALRQIGEKRVRWSLDVDPLDF